MKSVQMVYYLTGREFTGKKKITKQLFRVQGEKASDQDRLRPDFATNYPG